MLAASLPLAAHVTHNLSSSGFEDPGSRAVWADNQLAYVHPAGAETWLVSGPASGRVRRIASVSGVPAQDVRAVTARNTLVLPLSPIPPGAARSLRAALRPLGAQVRDVDQVSVGRQVLSDARTTLSQSLPFALPLVLASSCRSCSP